MDCRSRGACAGASRPPDAGAPHIEPIPGIGTIGSSVKIASNPCSIVDICSSEDDESSRCTSMGCDVPSAENDSIRVGWLDDAFTAL